MYNPLITISQSIHLRASWGIYQVLVSHTQITSYFLIFVQLYQRVCHLRSECVPILPLLWSFSQHWILFLSCLRVDEYPNGDINSLYDPFQLIWLSYWPSASLFELCLLLASFPLPRSIWPHPLDTSIHVLSLLTDLLALNLCCLNHLDSGRWSFESVPSESDTIVFRGKKIKWERFNWLPPIKFGGLVAKLPR